MKAPVDALIAFLPKWAQVTCFDEETGIASVRIIDPEVAVKDGEAVQRGCEDLQALLDELEG